MGRSGSPSRRQAAPRASAFESIAFDLYGLAPGEFTAARDRQVSVAKAASDVELARSLGELRRPTQAAWLVNLLWRDQGDVVEQLLTLGESFRTAQKTLAGDQLRALSTQRQRLITGLGRHARRLALAAGLRVSSDVARDAEITLETAMADEALASLIRSGRLTQAATYSGFGPVAAGLVNSSPPSPPPKVPAARKAPAVDPRREARRDAEATLGIASRDAAESSSKLTQAEVDVTDASRTRDELRGRIEESRYELRLLEDQLPEAERELRTLTRKRDQAKLTDTRAQRRLENSQRELDKLS
ncbi:hypothetical protein [Tenggerimyces flavus]|uniref:Uncharacterized protein n=1 Tax=Tenggerimyces flavus TaxID=1708749 RepID=A0ABV7YL59_9ACTN|nr:hypothetical protein [Tenggerimyces flavus]MBM7784944.1 hypothetical protein [Tenggerimyces flavus]